MAITYNDYVTLMANMMAIDSPANADYLIILPHMIEYAENRILRELDLVTNVTATVVNLVAGTRTVSVTGTLQIVQSAYLITPAATNPDAGVRNPLQRVSMEFLDFIWRTAATQGTPLYYAMQTDTTMVVAPTPSAAFRVEALGPVRPAALASGNQNTWIATNLPDLFIAASMVFGSGWQRNFGAQSDDPKVAMSWEAQYQTLKASADVDDARRKAQAFSWQAFSPEPMAKESRT